MEPIDKDIDAFQVLLRWGALDQAPTIYANQLLITHTGGEFYLIFGEVSPLGLIDKDNLPTQLEIKPIIKIVITPENMPAFAKVIQQNVENYKKRTHGKESDL
jgi:hypothetical protein